MDGPCPRLGTRTPDVDYHAPPALFRPLAAQPAPLPGIYLNTIPGARGVHLTAGNTLGQAIPLHQVHNMAMGPRPTDTNKPRHPVAGRRAGEPRPTDPSAPGPDRALLHLTMKPTAQLLTALEGETHFIVEGLTDYIIGLATNDAVGHPTARRDRIQKKVDTLRPEYMDQLLQLRSLTGPREQRIRRIGLEVTDWTGLDHTPDTPTVTLMSHQRTWCVAHRDGKGTAARVLLHTPETWTTSPLTLGNRFRHSTHHTDHPLAHWLALKTAMLWTFDAPATNTTLPTTWLPLARNVAAYMRRHRMTQTGNISSRAALTTCKPSPTRCGACTGPGKGTDRHTSSFQVATPQSRPPSKRRNQCGGGHSPDRRGRGHRPGEPNDLSRCQKQRRPRPSPNLSPRSAHTSHLTSARPCDPSTLMERKCQGSMSVC